jgi:hypothetical protein
MAPLLLSASRPRVAAARRAPARRAAAAPRADARSGAIGVGAAGEFAPTPSSIPAPAAGLRPAVAGDYAKASIKVGRRAGEGRRGGAGRARATRRDAGPGWSGAAGACRPP